nr:MAG TPA: hypothetical protein [Caudoviricetes sp.]
MISRLIIKYHIILVKMWNTGVTLERIEVPTSQDFHML